MLKIEDRIFLVNNGSFAETALEVFYYQYQSVGIYRQFCESLSKEGFFRHDKRSKTDEIKAGCAGL